MRTSKTGWSQIQGPSLLCDFQPPSFIQPTCIQHTHTLTRAHSHTHSHSQRSHIHVLSENTASGTLVTLGTPWDVLATLQAQSFCPVTSAAFSRLTLVLVDSGKGVTMLILKPCHRLSGQFPQSNNQSHVCFI